MSPAVPDGADFFGDDRQVLDTVEAGEHDALGRGVDRGRLVTAHPGADDRFAIGPRGQLGQHVADVDDRLAAEREPISQADGTAARM